MRLLILVVSCVAITACGNAAPDPEAAVESATIASDSSRILPAEQVDEAADPGHEDRFDTASADTVVIFETDATPGEGLPVLVARVATLALRAEPRINSAIVGFLDTTRGSEVEFDISSYQTYRSAEAVALTDVEFEAVDYGEVTEVTRAVWASAEVVNVRVAPSQVVEYLQYDAEGACYMRFDGRVLYDGRMCPIFFSDLFKLEAEPVTQWWVRIEGNDGAMGWVLESDSTLMLTERRF